MTMKRVRAYFENLARQHRALGHNEANPHFAYLNDEKDMLLPAQMGYPFVLLGHNGYTVADDGQHLVWRVLLSVQTHVTDTGDDREKNMATGQCGRIMQDLLVRAKSTPERLSKKWLLGIDLAGATAMMIENEDDALYGWAIEFNVSLPWCRNIDNEIWTDLSVRDIIDNY